MCMQSPRRLDGVMVPAVFNAAGRDKVVLSQCGTFDSAANVSDGR